MLWKPGLLLPGRFHHPFRPKPRYRAWLPDTSPDCFVVYRPGRRPKLVFTQPDDYWYLPPERPEGYWVGHFDLEIVRSPAELRKAAGGVRWAVLGEPGPATEGLGDHDPPAVTAPLDYTRAIKTPYEIECMALATVAGVRAHRAAGQAFLEAFHRRHHRLYSYRHDRRPVEIVNLRLKAVAHTPKKKQMELEMKERELGLKAQEMQMSAQFKQDEMALKADAQRQETEMSLAAKERENELGMEAGEHKHRLGMEALEAKTEAQMKAAKAKPKAKK